MRTTTCPREETLACFVDGDLRPEEVERVVEHLASCGSCREREHAFREIVTGLREPALAQLDVRAHVGLVLRALDRPARSGRGMSRTAIVAGAAALAACVSLMAGVPWMLRARGTQTWQARGGAAEATIARDVGVQPYAYEGTLRPLAAGAIVARDTPLTAGFRNIGDAPAFLLFFAIDVTDKVHWISPPFASEDGDPRSTELAPTFEERLLASTAVLDELSAGPLRLVAVLTPVPARVSDVESLAPAELTSTGLARRMPGAEVRETVVQVRADARKVVP
ncbi:MAG TPA: zf-HC2 domain-containing protein [Polyangiaceae bacterium]|nr:zf-HC2 domain-containing protein [Polyangiaceae bacterium]